MKGSIRRNWPVIEPYLPPGLEQVGYRRWMAFVDAFTNEKRLLKPDWAAGAMSGARFAAAPAVPEGFLAVGAYVSNYEHLFVMWQREGRRFHFYDLYFGGGFVEASGVDLYAKTREHLDRALEVWERTTDSLVAYALGSRLDAEWARRVGAPAPSFAEPDGSEWTALRVPDEAKRRVH